MNKIFSALLLTTLCFSYINVNSQNVLNYPNYWEGKMQAGGQTITFWLKVYNDNDSIKGTIDIPEQGIANKEIDELNISGNIFAYKLNAYLAEYTGIISKDRQSIVGKWTQMNKDYNLDFIRLKDEPRLNRPQEPKPPYPYSVEEVEFENKKTKIKLKGTLTLPENSWNAPAVILVSGSGPQDRNSEIFGHKPFLVLADYFTKNGIAVLRFDDRGTGESEGNFQNATTYDFTDDVETAFNFLKNHKSINSKNIGIVGHSEGGVIAPLLASKNKYVAFIVMMAGPGSSGEDILYQQTELIGLAEGKSKKELKKDIKFLSKVYKVAKSDKSYKEGFKSLRKLYKRKTFFMTQKRKEERNLTKQFTEAITMQVMSSWFREFLRLQPSDYLPKVKCPVLAISGNKDLQVPPDPNIILIEKLLAEADNKSVTIVRLDNLNHLFQHCETGSVTEYPYIEETFSVEGMKIIADWINKTRK